MSEDIGAAILRIWPYLDCIAPEDSTSMPLDSVNLGVCTESR